MFVGRKTELEKLNKMYDKMQFEFAVFYGRRRVGKTTLINEFCKNKKVIYFVAVEATEKENLENLSKAIFDAIIPSTPSATFESYEKAVDYIFEYGKREQIVFIIDEYPYLASSYKPISSILQKYIDKYHDSNKLFLILCGSSMSFMENQVLGYKSPLYGRRTAQFKILPFTYFEANQMLYGFSNEDKAILYGATGGIPEYLSRIDNSLSLKENIVELFLTTSGRLFEEPSNLLKQELRDPQTYNSILTAIAEGSSKLNQIATKVGIETSACSNLLSTLISLGIVKKDIPVGEKSNRKTIYLLEDQMFRFWYRFVAHNMNSIVSGFGEKVYDKVVLDGLSTYMGLVFEEICKQYMFELLKNDKLPFFFGSIGRWWGNNKLKKREEEIDIVAIGEKNAIFAECKWKNESIGIDVLNGLKEQASMFNYDKKYLYLFSKTGFKSDVFEDDNIKLITFDEMNF